MGVHWTCCAVLMKKKKIIYLDSMGGNNNECMETILDYLKTEHKTRNMLKIIKKSLRNISKYVIE